MLIGREGPLKTLKDCLIKDSSSFVAVYGRRRVGKTFLVNQVFAGNFLFSTTGVFPKKKQAEMDQFIASLKDAGASIEVPPKKWIDAFQLLKALIEKSAAPKKVIFFDELAWLAAPSPDFLRVLSGFWNGWASKRNDIILIVCASAASWMTDNVIHDKGGLYQRLTDQIYLQPFSLKECEEMASAMHLPFDRHAILEAYMIFGGIPFYWSRLSPQKSLAQNVDALFGGPDAPFKNEFAYLYSSLFESPEPYIALITALGKAKTSGGLNRDEVRLAARLADTGLLSKRLRELEDCGFIRRYHQFGAKERGSLYQLIDNFSLFYFKFLEGGVTDPNFYSHSLDLPSRRAWSGLAFERVCLQHIEQVKTALGAKNVLSDVSAFSVRSDREKGIEGSQIDLVIERRDRLIDLCEMKFASEEFVIDKEYDQILRRKRSDFKRATKTRFAVCTVMVTPYGLFDNAYSKNVTASLTSDDLFA
jgi:uncharacterized protein